jgi:hypothetical protein
MRRVTAAVAAGAVLIVAIGVWYWLTQRAPATVVEMSKMGKGEVFKMGNGAAFSLTGPGHPVGLNDQVIIGFTLRNPAQQARYFNARFAVAPSVGEIRPTVIDPSGKEAPFAVRVRLGPLLASDFVHLQPGEAVSAGFPLRHYYKINTPGTYVVSATYVASEVPQDLEKLPVFQGTLKADPISIVFSGSP